MTASTQPSLTPAVVARALGGTVSGNSVSAPAPGHSKADRSLSILIDPAAPDGFVVYPHAGEDPLAMKDYIRGKLGHGPWQPGGNVEPTRVVAFPKVAPKPFSDVALLAGGYEFVCAYSYTSADGVEAFEVCRYEHPTKGKTFLQRHYEENGRAMSGRFGGPILYRLHEIATTPDEPIFFVEGEKDADNLATLGFLATTVPNNSWPDDLTAIEGRTFYLLADNDTAGESRAEKAIERLSSVASVQRIDLPGLPAKGDVTDWLEAGGTADVLVALCDSAQIAPALGTTLKAANDNKPIKATPFVLRDPVLIPPREWLFGRHYARKYLTATFGAGGGGKSANSISEVLSMVTGRGLMGDKPEAPLRVWYINLEDPAVEIERRFAGAAKHFGVTAEQIGDRLYADSGRDQEFVVMRLDGRNTTICDPVVKQIIAEAKARQIDVIVVDPFVSTHEVEENDNTRIQQVAALWVRIADESNCSVELIHHISKGNTEVTADSGRGASSLKDKARSVRVINPMSESEATSIGIGKDDARSYFRVDLGKHNMSKYGGSSWRRFASVSLGNGRKKMLGIPQDSDEIGVVEPWQWPSAASLIEGVDPELLAGIKARIGAGNFRESEQSGDWAGHVVAELTGKDSSDATEKRRIKRMLQAWIAAGELAIEMRPDAKRISRKHIVSVASPPQKLG